MADYRSGGKIHQKRTGKTKAQARGDYARGAKKRTESNKMMKVSSEIKHLRSPRRTYKEGESPAPGTSGKIPIKRGKSAGRFEEGGKSIKWSDK